jgi:GAF domain-containing protein/anti-sigma regulatory factor (Ser/Thr protein kinase)
MSLREQFVTSESSLAELKAALAQATRERDEALEREAATAEVLRAISSSSGELAPVFQAMLENATRICEANFGTLLLCEGDGFRAVALHGAVPAYADARRREPVFRPGSNVPLARAIRTKQVQHVVDLSREQAYIERDAAIVTMVEAAGARTFLAVPMLKDEEAIGAIIIYRQEVRPFSDEQVDLVQSFAAQAVIAIENARLLNELREALEQQTATSEVLQIISASPGELAPVFESMLANATRICQAKFGTLYLYEDGAFRAVAMHNVPPAFLEARRRQPVVHPSPDNPMALVAATKRSVQSADVPESTAWPRHEPNFALFAKLTGARSLICVPMLKDDALVGVITVYRLEARPFTEKQTELLTNFAAQAVIAIENARLLNELRQRTDDLTESLQQQTATSDILEVISNSPTDSQPAFDAIVHSGLKLFPDSVVVISLPEGDQVKLAALAGADAGDLAVLRARYPMPLSHEFITGSAILDGREMDFADARETPERLMPGRENFLASGYRAITVMPMMRGETAIGAISVIHRRPRQLSDKQRELLRTFASQAVIAIENTRLFNELRQRTDDLTESLEQQTATSEVLEVISASPGELDPVFDAILGNATRLCGAKFGTLYLCEGDAFRLTAMHNAPQAFANERRRNPVIYPQPDNMLGRVVRAKHAVQTEDATKEPLYLDRNPLFVAAVELGGFRSFVSVPMLKDDRLVGAINIYRQEVRAFTEKQIELVTNFAAQAVIAIENARLLNELRQRTDDLTESLEQQTASGEILASISGSMADTKPVFGAIVRNLRRLFGTRFSMVQLLEDGIVHLAATGQEDEYGLMSKYYPRPLDGAQAPDRAMMARQVMQFVPVIGNPECPRRMQDLARQLGFNATIFAPMLRDGKVIGVIAVARDEAKTFTEKQVELIKTFAAQAVIAIENTRLFNELRESLDQQTATSEVLQVISSSPGKLEPVFAAMLENAARICEAKFGTLFRFDGERFHFAAQVGTPAELVDFQKRRGPFEPNPGSILDQVLRTKSVHYAADITAWKVPSPAAKLGGARSFVCVPMLKDGELIGAFNIYRQEVRPFTEKQVELLQNFAAQAVIAIENARLLNELRQRTDDLAVALEQQTATADVLSVMSRSKFDLMPILQSVVDTAMKLCRADQAVIFRLDGDVYRYAAGYSLVPEYLEIERANPIAPGPGTAVGRAAMSRKVVRIEDAMSDADYEMKEQAAVAHVHSIIGVPLLRDGEPIGVIALARCRVEPFSDREVELVTTFADQAVIAIENVRLFEEVQARTEDLTESLQQQTATADVLKVISRSTFDLQTVFDALIESAAKLCRADRVSLRLLRNGAYHAVALHGYSPEHDAYMKSHPATLGPSSLAGRAILAGKPVQVEDITKDSDLSFVRSSPGFEVIRTLLAVLLLREGAPIGVLVLSRERVDLFTDKQIDLVTTFADQAVIAIENVRLFDEIQDKSRQLEEASKHKSQFLANMSHELRTPLNAILGYTELIVDGVYGETPEKVQNALKRITTNGKHLLGLINDVLDLSKIEAGQLTLSLTDYSMKDVVHAVYGAVEPLAAEKKLSFKAEIAPDMPAGHGDERRLTQVLLNLVGNAIKFTDEGEVKIKAAASDGHFSVAVVDTGPGISEDDQKKLFQEFQQADSSTTKKKGGTGLGLAISKKIVEMHGGSVRLESAPGQGSTFSFTVPLRAEQAKKQA